jgi:hypothetical protein
MRSARVPPACRARSPRVLAVPGLALLTLLLLALAPAASATGGGWADPPSWGNGVVFCSFDAAFPSVLVSPAGLVGSGVGLGAAELFELNPLGSEVAVAHTGAASWSVTNASTDDAYDLRYSASVPITPPNSTSTPLGSVSIILDFVLSAYTNSSSPPSDQVAVGLAVTGWAWQNASDRLAVSWSLAAGSPAEHLAAGGPTNGSVSSVSNSSGMTIGAATLGTAGNATRGVSAPRSIPATPELSLSGGTGTLTAIFTPSGEFSGLQYGVTVTIEVPSTIAGIPLTDFAAVGLVAGALVALVAVGTRRVRHRPSDLIYVDEGRR